MSLVNSNSLILAAGGDYQISRSVRLRNSASAYFSRTYATSPTNNKINTFSGWVKRGTLGTLGYIFTAYDGTSALAAGIWFQSDKLWAEYGGPSGSGRITTTQVFRDPSAWYHIVLAIDTTQATASNRVKLYINGVQVTAFDTATNPTLNLATAFTYPNSNNRVGANWDNSGPFDGYLTEINFIDGQQLTPSSFGETNPVTGVWQPKQYTGTYGTNGFYLNFSDNSAATAAAIGKDYSGNGNNWTPNNISVTAGSTYDSMLDVPTLWADGGNGRGNYAVMNPVGAAGGVTFSNGNLRASVAQKAAPRYIAISSIAFTGIVYAEVTVTPGGGPNPSPSIGIKNSNYKSFEGSATTAGEFAYGFRDSSTPNILKDENGSSSTFVSGGSISSGDVMMLAVDVAAGKMWLGKNGSWLQSGNPAAVTNPAISGFSAVVPYWFYCSTDQGTTTDNVFDWNFGQRPFSYTPPTGFKALNTGNLPEPTIVQGNKWMDATIYTGTGATQTITNSGSMQPDFVWAKSRSSAESHRLEDSVRGATQALYSNLTNAETTEAQSITAFNSGGFTLGTGTPNTSAVTYVAWQWKAGGTPAVTNTNGSITSTVSVSTTSGFSIVSYTGTGSAATVGHGLGVVPRLIIVKSRSTAGDPWTVYSASLANTQYLYLNSTAAAATGVNIWNSTTPTSSVFSIGAAQDTNRSSGTYIAYCFAQVAGFSAFGSYTGNGSSDGPFVYLGFRPAFLMIKRTDASNDWAMHDDVRIGYNAANYHLLANSSSAEFTDIAIDLLSNGFKPRGTSGTENASGGTYIYMAFAENPFRNSLAR